MNVLVSAARRLTCAFFILLLWSPLSATTLYDQTPRIAVISAFAPELELLQQELQEPQSYTANGIQCTTGMLQGQPVVLFLSGISMVNAAMTTQLALDRFHITHIVFSGIAGGVNPDLHIGDVVVAQRWGQYLEVLMARELDSGEYDLSDPEGLPAVGERFGMMLTRPVRVRSTSQPELHQRFWFDADPEMLSVARELEDVPLSACLSAEHCLSRQPSVVVGGNGVSGSAFLNNARLRAHLFDEFEANVVDMESAACAMVAYSNDVPFIAFRSLSDLAGGNEGANEMNTFLALAAGNSARVLMAFLEAWGND